MLVIENKEIVVLILKAAISSGKAAAYGLSKRLEPVVNCRGVTKHHMVLNDLCPNITGRSNLLLPLVYNSQGMTDQRKTNNQVLNVVYLVILS